jgi:uncharacterized membrane protein YbhN (UPF0104 family)
LLSEQPDLIYSWNFIQHTFNADNLFWFLLFFMLMLMNWWLEIKKWQILVLPFEKITFFSAFKAVIGSLAFGIATPNRVGEYGFRALYLKPGNRKMGVMLTLLSSMAQLVFTIAGGLVATFYFVYVHIAKEHLRNHFISFILIFIFILFIGLILFISFYRLTSLIRFLQRFSFFRKVIPDVSHTEVITNYLRLRVLILSSIRYIIFLAQYIIIWKLFDAGISWQESLLSSAIIFLLMAFVPTIALAELGIRGRISVWIVGVFSQKYLAILAGATTVWFVNLFLPAILGACFLWSFKIKKNQTG